MHAEKRSNHVHSPLIDGKTRRRAARGAGAGGAARERAARGGSGRPGSGRAWERGAWGLALGAEPEPGGAGQEDGEAGEDA
ncbi:hypothetical protein Pa4123_26690 [Phytohabitans aurantiacus]|uniref:Uncharacterized protein n=1 Tax=Phytohabitans aurantiacus TaxID=3016789 RepID=A0ABQ5QUK4_9ACTN|nr:hypothetical protein Pa4123_26690 [Phytohabitans aurantiacus]